MHNITSSKNEMIKNAKKLKKRKYRQINREYIIEGYHLVEEALKSESKIKKIFVIDENDDFLEKVSEKIPVYLITKEILSELSDVPAPQGILAIIDIPDQVMDFDSQKPFLLLDNVQDPGNVGTIIRTADAAGFQMVVLGTGCADVYSSKVLRSMQGSHFHVSIYQADLEVVMSICKKNNLPIYGTELNVQAVSYKELQPPKVFGLLLGNEGQGVTQKLLFETTKNVYIPIYGKAESLNVAVAAGILMFALKK